MLTQRHLHIKIFFAVSIILLAVLTLLVTGCAGSLEKETKAVTKTITISVKSSPDGARVTLDGNKHGMTPADIKITYLHTAKEVHESETRNRELLVEKPGYEPYVIRFSIKDRKFEGIPAPIQLKKLNEASKAKDSIDKKKDTQKLITKEESEIDKLKKEIAVLKVKNAQQKIEFSEKIQKYEAALKENKQLKEQIALLRQKKIVKEIKTPDRVVKKEKVDISVQEVKPKIVKVPETIVKPPKEPSKKPVPAVKHAPVKTVENKKPVKDSIQTVYTLQTGSFTRVPEAHNQYELIKQKLNKKQLDYLRIEKVGSYYVVRLGSFDNRTAAESFQKAIKSKLPSSLVMKAYIKEERIIKSYLVQH